METAYALELFLRAKRAKGLSKQTLSSYTYRLGVFARCCPRLPEIPEELEACLSIRGPSDENRESYYRLLRNLYHWLARRRLIQHNPMEEVERPLLRRKVARSLSLPVLHQLLGHPGHPPKVRAFLYLLADTGLRLSEALSVGPQNLEEDLLVLRGNDGLKTGERQVPISPIVACMVRDALPWPWGGWQAAGLAVRRAFRRAGIGGKRASAHTLRHTFTRLWEGDESLLVGILGWTSPKMLSVYRPYDTQRALAQHRQYSPVTLARDGQRQMSFLWD